MSETVTRWWWIRHAPVTTDQGCFYGQQDLPADTTINAHVYGDLAEALPKNAIWVASHLQRTHQTAQAIGAAGYPLPSIDYHEDLAEQHFGNWQGKPRAPVHKQYGGIHGFWMTLLDERPTNGESFRDLRSRVDNVVDHLSAEYRGRDIVAVAHGGTIRAAIARALDLPSRMALNFTIGNSSLTRLALIQGPNRSAYWNITLLNGYGVS